MERNSRCVEIARRALAVRATISRGSQHEHEKFFIQDVPDCPKIWSPLVPELGLSDEDYFEPALPGFEAPPPRGFKRAKNGYVDFLVERLEDVVSAYGLFGSVGGGPWVIAEGPRAVATTHIEH